MLRGSILPKAFATFSFSLLALAPVLSAGVAAAAWDEKIYNPRPSEGDVVLPMPCDGAMAFRKVAVPMAGPLDDYRIEVGGTGGELGYAEASRAEHLAAGFGAKGGERYLLMAKYETTELQYAAVMADACPKPIMAGRLPKGAVGWADSVAFADRYTAWLLANAPKTLPKADGQAGFLRLPTETEWEFAARGGIKVSPAEFRDVAFPMPEGMARHVWFAGSQSANGKVQLTGLLEANPLGLHDMLGNVDEIVLDAFRLNKLGRLHGQAGGTIVRGGNVFTAPEDIRNSLRQEVVPYDRTGPRRSPTTGFRTVIAAPVLGSPQTIKTVQEGWLRLGTEAETTGARSSSDPVEELALIAQVLPDPAMQDRLKRLQIGIRATIAAQNQQRDRAARTSLRLGAFLGSKLGNDARAVDALAELVEMRRTSSAADDARLKDFEKQLEDEQAIIDGNLRYYADTLIGTATDYPVAVLEAQAELLTVELSGIGLTGLVPHVHEHLRNVQTYAKNRKVRRSSWLRGWRELTEEGTR